MVTLRDTRNPDLAALRDAIEALGGGGGGGGVVEMRATSTHLQWRQGDGDWQDLVDLASLREVVSEFESLTVTGDADIGGALGAGSIDSTPIGGTTPAAGAFTTLSSSGAAKIDGKVYEHHTSQSIAATTTADIRDVTSADTRSMWHVVVSVADGFGSMLVYKDHAGTLRLTEIINHSYYTPSISGQILRITNDLASSQTYQVDWIQVL